MYKKLPTLYKFQLQLRDTRLQKWFTDLLNTKQVNSDPTAVRFLLHFWKGHKLLQSLNTNQQRAAWARVCQHNTPQYPF